MGNNIGKRNPERKRERFSKEFKLEAIRLLELGQKPATQLALELGIARNRLYKRQEQLGKVGKEHAFRGPGRKPEDEPSENERLRAALKRMTEERDILKKAVACCAGPWLEWRYSSPAWPTSPFPSLLAAAFFIFVGGFMGGRGARPRHAPSPTGSCAGKPPGAWPKLGRPLGAWLACWGWPTPRVGPPRHTNPPAQVKKGASFNNH